MQLYKLQNKQHEPQFTIKEQPVMWYYSYISYIWYWKIIIILRLINVKKIGVVFKNYLCALIIMARWR